MIIDLTVPMSWGDLSQKHLKFIYRLIADDVPLDELKNLFLFRFNNIEVISRNKDGKFLLRRKKQFFEVYPVQIAEAISSLEYLNVLPDVPVCISKLKFHKAIPANFEGVDFEKFIICDNLYQGYLQTQAEGLLEELTPILYNHRFSPSKWQGVAIFFWMASLKNFFSKKFSDFFAPVNDDSSFLAKKNVSAVLEDSVNAQIRALTKGDVTREKEVLALDTWRALTELNSQAREYKELNSYAKKS